MAADMICKSLSGWGQLFTLLPQQAGKDRRKGRQLLILQSSQDHLVPTGEFQNREGIKGILRMHPILLLDAGEIHGLKQKRPHNPGH